MSKLTPEQIEKLIVQSPAAKRVAARRAKAKALKAKQALGGPPKRKWMPPTEEQLALQKELGTRPKFIPEGAPALGIREESFVSNVLSGMSPDEAFKKAGFIWRTDRGAHQSALNLARKPAIQAALAAGREERARIKEEATKLAIEHSGITMDRVAVELSRIGFANMMDFMRIDPKTGDPALDWSNLTREQAAALTEVTVDDYVDGRGENARDVRKVRFKLGDKRAALMDIGKLFGWIVEKRENKIVDEFDTMTAEQLEAWLDEHAERRLNLKHRTHTSPSYARQNAGRGVSGGIGGIGSMRTKGNA